MSGPMVDQTQLPLLPGYRIQTVPKERYHKTHMFDVSNGTRCDVNRDGQLVDKRMTGTNPLLVVPLPTEHQERGLEAKATASSTMSQLPAWVAYDRKVLRFYGFFTEPVHSSPAETWRIRKCVFYYYLEDDSMHIAEPRVENSGIPQGVLLKRHRVIKDNQYLTVDDLFVGAELELYGRAYYVVDADESTRQFYAEAGKSLADALEYPVDNFTKKSTLKPASHNKQMHPYKAFLEASLGKQLTGMEVAATQKFLKNDGKVLRFYCQWDDKNLFGEKRPYVLHYFLADDTVEVLEVQQQNSGRPPFSNLLRRQRLPKDSLNNLDMSRIGQETDSKVRFYGEEDFKIGETISVFNRPLFICGCDAFTQRYYTENYDMKPEDFTRIGMEDVADFVPTIEPPPHTGFGSEEDSLGSYLHLMPKVPKPDFKKLMENDGICLRFPAQFVNPTAIDRNRRFIVSFYLNNDQVSVFEKPERNSGFVGGKFLERTRFKNPSTGAYFKAADFKIGAELTINTVTFKLGEPDEYTKRFMNEHPEIYEEPKAPVQRAVKETGGRVAGMLSPLMTAGSAVTGVQLHPLSAPLDAKVVIGGPGASKPASPGPASGRRA